MEAVPEQSVVDKKATLAARYRSQAGQVLPRGEAQDRLGSTCLNFQQQSVCRFNVGAHPGQTTPVDEAKALCAWHNSTPGVLGFLMRRGKV